MSRFFKFTFFILIITAAVLLSASQTKAADIYCFCYDDVSKMDSKSAKTTVDKFTATNCIDLGKKGNEAACNPDYFLKSGLSSKRHDGCYGSSSQKDCHAKYVNWTVSVANQIKKAYPTDSSASGLVGKFIPKCVTEDTLSASCRDVSIFVTLAMNIAKYLFTIVGALALLMFIYGGLTLIISQGNPEKTKKGFDIIVAALIGIIIMFSAYMLVKFLGSSVVGVKSDYILN